MSNLGAIFWLPGWILAWAISKYLLTEYNEHTVYKETDPYLYIYIHTNIHLYSPTAYGLVLYLHTGTKLVGKVWWGLIKGRGYFPEYSGK